MKSKQHNSKKQRGRKTTPELSSVVRRSSPSSLFERCNAFFTRHEQMWFWGLMAVTLLTSILLYDPRISVGGDDSAYIVTALDFWDDFEFVNYQGPLYPIVLSIVYAIFGMSLKAFKTFSMLSMLACMYFIYRAFRNRIPSTLLFVTLLFTSFNSHVLYFASQTYSEAFYMFIQSLLLFIFFNFFVDSEKTLGKNAISAEIKRHLLLAAVLLCAVLTRSIGYSLFLAIIGYFIVFRQWKNLVWSVVCFFVCFAGYQLLINVLWGNESLQASSQADSLLNKDFYRPELGRENLAGFIERLWTNSNQYISRFFMIMIGFRKTFTSEGFFVHTIPAITVIVYLLGLTGLFFSYRQNRFLFFSGVVAGAFLIVTFIVLHAHWNQFRLIVPAYPLMILLLFSGLYYVMSIPKLRWLQFLLFAPAVIIFFTMLADTSDAAAKAGKLKNEYSGLTPDWFNYAKASEWAAENLPKDAYVACRKPSISTIYGKGKKFYGIYSVRSGNFDAFYERWKADSTGFSIVPLEGMNEQMYNATLGSVEARLLLGEKSFFAVKDRERLQELSDYFENYTIINSPRDLEHIANEAGIQKAVYYPDSLLAPLRERNVTHILTANLRLNPNIKDGQIINTVERIAYFVQEKYPAIFNILVQIGNPNDEPAEIFQINWDEVK